MSDQAIYPGYFNQEHRQTLDALGAMMGDKELLEGHSPQYSISLVEVSLNLRHTDATKSVL